MKKQQQQINMNINNMLLSDYFMLHKDYRGREADFYVCIFSLLCLMDT